MSVLAKLAHIANKQIDIYKAAVKKYAPSVDVEGLKFATNLLDLSKCYGTVEILDENTGSLRLNYIPGEYYANIRVESSDLLETLLDNQNSVFTLTCDNMPADYFFTCIIYGNRDDGEKYQGHIGTSGTGLITFTPSGFNSITAVDLRLVIKGYSSTSTDTTTIISGLRLYVGDEYRPFTPYISPESIRAEIKAENFLNFIDLTEQTVNGITFTPFYKNGSLDYILVNGTATAKAQYVLSRWGVLDLPLSLYICSGTPSGGSYITYYMSYAFVDYSTGATIKDAYDLGTGMPIEKEFSKCKIYCDINIASGATVNNLKFRPQMEKGNIKTDYKPYISLDTIREAVGAKNLFDITANDNIIAANLASGVRIGDNITVTSNSASESAYCILPQTISLKAGLTYVCSHKIVNTTDSRYTVIAFFKDGNIGAYLAQNKYKPSEDIDVNLAIYVKGVGSAGDTVTITDIQCEQNTEATEYEPYNIPMPAYKANTIKENQYRVYDAAVRRYATRKTTEKSDFISAPDSAGYKFLDFGMDGKTEQRTRVGKNLWDGKGVLNGYFGNVISEGSLFRICYIKCLPSTTYTISKVKTERCCIGCTNELPVIGSAVEVLNDDYTTTVATIRTTDNAQYIVIYCYNANLDTLSFEEISNSLQIELGSEATEYEPYIGGITPNPYHPEEVVNAGKLGKNLYSGGDVSGVQNVVRTIEPIPAGTYTVSANVSSTDTDSTERRMLFYSNDTLVSLAILTDGNRVSHTKVNMGSEVNKIVFYGSSQYASAAGDTFSFTDIQIEEGDVATEYKPYTGRYEIDCNIGNKNLFDVEKAKDANYWVKATNNGYRGFIVQGKPNTTYTISAEKLKDTTDYVAVANSYRDYFDDDGNCIADTNINITRFWHQNGFYKGENSASITTDDTGKILILHARYGLIETFLINIQIEEGPVATPYEPYITKQITLTSPVPITKWDKLVKRDGVWGWSVNSDKKIFDGTEAWYQFGESVALTNWDDFKTIQHSNAYVTLGAFCNIAINGQKTSGGDGKFTTYHMDSIAWIVFNINIALADWQSYLADRYASGTPVYVQYPTAEEQAFYPLPDDEQLLLKKMETYHGGTHMTNDQGCPMWLEYVVDPETL